MDIGIVGIYILPCCGVSMIMAGLVYIVYYKVLQIIYRLIVDEIEWNITNVILVLWCTLVMIGVSPHDNRYSN